MADIDKITASNGTTYNIKDATARDSISQISDTDIKSSNVASGSVTFFGNGLCVGCNVNITALSSMPTVRQSYAVGTVPNGKRPSTNTWGALFSLDKPVGTILINPGGPVSLRFDELPSSTSGQNIRGSVMWPI